MQPIGPLMIEHRLIEQAVDLLKTKAPDREFVVAIVDFFRTYADKVHHGKEEDILFKALEKKKLIPEHKNVLDRLLAEHVYARKTVGKLLESVGPSEAKIYIDKLADLYPKHIEMEDKHFFIPIMDYFSRHEQDEMLVKMRQFDERVVHDKYKDIINNLRGK